MSPFNTTHQLCRPSYGDSLLVDFPSVPQQQQHYHQPKKQVNFSTTSRLHVYEKRVASPPSWHNKIEYASFRRDVKMNVLAARQGLAFMSTEVINEDELHIHGIEHLVCQHTLRKIVMRRDIHKDAVLQQHARQLRYAVHAPEALRKASKDASRESRVWAYRLAAGKKISISTPAA